MRKATNMPKRLASLFALAVTATALLGALFAGSASAAPAPWWQVLDGSRPSHLWQASDTVQEITTEITEIEGFGSGLVAKVKLQGEVIACLGAGEFAAFCPAFVQDKDENPAPVVETASSSKPRSRQPPVRTSPSQGARPAVNRSRSKHRGSSPRSKSKG